MYLILNVTKERMEGNKDQRRTKHDQLYILNSHSRYWVEKEIEED